MAIIVNGEKIEDSAVQKEVERLRPDYERVFAEQSPEDRETQLLQWSKDNLIEKVLIRQECRKNAKISAEAIQSAFDNLKKDYESQEQFYKEFSATTDEEVKQTIELVAAVRELYRHAEENMPKPSKQDMLKYYEENKDDFKSPERVRVAHIVKHVNWQMDEAAAQEQIANAYTELRNGVPFEMLVERYSDCPEDGGDLGLITRGQMVEEFDDVVFNLHVGEVSDIFRTRFGFHIAKLYDRKPPAALGFEEVKGEVAAELSDQIRQKAFEDLLDQLRSEADIEET
jgi:parvulin-like peptidyl-prolyl isomerase